jgi:WD40 repeat protein
MPEEKDRPWLVIDSGGHTAGIPRVFLTPDARRAVSVSWDKTVRVWDVATGDPLHVLRLPIGRGDEGALFAAALSPDGRRLGVGGMPFGGGPLGIPIYVISLETGKVERAIKGHTGVIQALAFSPNGKYLASGATDRLIGIFEVETGKVVRAYKGHTDRLRQIAWHPRGELFASTAHDGTLRLWEFRSGKPLHVLPGGSSKILSVAWSPDGTQLATGSQDGTLQIRSPDGRPQKTYKLPPSGGAPLQVTSLSFTPDARELLYTGVDTTGRVGLVDVATGKRRVFSKHSNTVAHGSLSADGKLAVSAGGNREEIFIWKTEDLKVVQQLQGRGSSVWAVGWARDGRTVAWGHDNRGVTTDATTRLERTFHLDRLEFGGEPAADCLRFPREVNGYSLQALDHFRVAIKHNGKAVRTFSGPMKGDRIYSFAVVGGDRAVIGASFGMYLIDLKTAGIVRHLKGHSAVITGVSPSPDGRYVLTGASDQTMCLWDLQGELPLLTLFAAGRDWIAWTPQGYYACSAQGERLMGWQVNHGLEKMASYYPAVQFRASLYRPDVVKLLRRAGGLGKALAVAGRKHKGAAAAVNVTQVLPPQVRIAAPVAGNLPAGQAKVEVRAEARPTGKHPVTAMRLLVDGRPYDGLAGVRTFKDGGLGERQATWTVALSPGKHTLAVQAESPVSKGISAPVEVARAEDKPAGPPNLYVLAVGISAYAGKAKLNYAHKDAIVLERTLKERAKGVFARVETKLITDKAATRKAILDGLAWLRSVMTARDVGIIFFAGHGAQDPEGNFHLVPVDVDPKDPRGTCIAGELLKQKLGDMPGRLIAMLDACHSGASAEGKMPGKRPARQATDDLVRDLVTDDYGVIVMCSSLGHEYSLESTETGHGFFTLGLVEGLNGKADLNDDRVIHIHEVDAYAFVRVRGLSRGQQNPVTGRPPNIRSFPLARY